MNKMKQFWALFKFQTTINPAVWFMTVAFGAPMVFMSSFTKFAPDLSTILPVQNLFFVGLLGMWALAPEMAQRPGGLNLHTGTDFLLTRAVDRSVFYRSRSAYFYILVLIAPLFFVLYAETNPNLKVSEYSEAAREECLANVPGSELQPNPIKGASPLIAITRGNVLVQEWHLWMFVVAALFVQGLLLIVYPLKFRMMIFYVIIFSSISLPLLGIHSPGNTPLFERCFFAFAAHPEMFWMVTVVAAVFGHLLCERGFCRQEH